VIHSTRKSNNDAPAVEFLFATTGGQAVGRPDYKAAVQRLAFFSQAMFARLDLAALTGTGCWAQEPSMRVPGILIPRTGAAYIGGDCSRDARYRKWIDLCGFRGLAVVMGRFGRDWSSGEIGRNGMAIRRWIASELSWGRAGQAGLLGNDTLTSL
jgi:hypothetical protein